MTATTNPHFTEPPAARPAMTPTTAALFEIRCLSPRNVRGEGDGADGRDLAASILAYGLIHPLVVEQWTDGFAVVDGGRRFAALRSLVDDGAIDMSFEVPIVVVDIEGAGAISLAANVLRRDLHPVEEFEAFARLAAGGESAEAIATHFGRSLRFVRQRLALDKLSPRVRALWRADTIKADVAIAFTRAPDHAAQDAYLDLVTEGRATLAAFSVVGHFSKAGGKRADSPEALYVGLDAYQAAGGKVDDNLFQDWSICEDGALLGRLAREKMLAEGSAILERTGFGTCLIAADVEQSWDWGQLPVDFTQADHEELAAIDARQQAAIDAAVDDDDADALDDDFSAEREAVNLRALQRGTTADQRAQAAIFLRLHHEGRLHIEYGRTPPRQGKTDRGIGGTGAASPRSTPAGDSSAPPPAEERKPTRAVTECLDDARQRAFAKLISVRPMLAMLLCTAALRVGANRSPLRIAATGRNGTIPEPPFVSLASALTELMSLPDRDHLLDAFARAVAQTVAMVTPTYERNGGHADPTDTDGLALILAHFADEDFEPQLAAALDYPAYFRAATRAAALAAIEEAGGDVNDARKLKADKAAELAAGLASDKGWLPKALRAPPPIARALALDDSPEPAPTLADAMAVALEADEPPTPVLPSDSVVAEFLSWACEESAAGSASRADLYAAFKRTSSPATRKIVSSEYIFDAAMHALGFTRDGPAYLGLYLPSALAQPQAAE